MGQQWYESGKLLSKKNTFYDFIDCAEFLVAGGYTSTEGLVGIGRSAGGLLVGAVANMRPELFLALIADVPFVDLMNTMLDESIALTALEYEEWGNPNEQPYFDYMLSYSPYDNVTAQDYPHMLVETAINDPYVGYWEPAKWVARLRSVKTDSHRLLLRTNMESGHAGVAGRYGILGDYAFEIAFILNVLPR